MGNSKQVHVAGPVPVTVTERRESAPGSIEDPHRRQSALIRGLSPELYGGRIPAEPIETSRSPRLRCRRTVSARELLAGCIVCHKYISFTHHPPNGVDA